MANNIRACFIDPEDHQGPVTFGDWDFIKEISDEIAHERKISGMAGKLELAFFHSNKSRWRVLSPASSLYHKKMRAAHVLVLRNILFVIPSAVDKFGDSRLSIANYSQEHN